MRIASWNVNSLNARMPRVEEWLERMKPDVVCIQETKLDNESFPAEAFEAMAEDTRSSFSRFFEDRLGVFFVLCRLWDAVLSMCVDFCPLYFNCGGAP